MGFGPVRISFRAARVGLLLLALAAAGGYTWWERLWVRSWQAPLAVEIYPISGDGAEDTARYMQSLSSSQFQPIAGFFASQMARFRLGDANPVQVSLGPEIHDLPPVPPKDGNPLRVVAWSLSLRYWVYRHTPSILPSFGKIRLFVVYHTVQEGEALPHSLGLEKGLIGVVHAFASTRQDAQNNVVIAHELLHTLGATDKYGAGGQPVFPDGYGDRDRHPLYPQDQAEIMAGRIAVTATRAEMPASLAYCVIGAKTAYEINW